MDSSSRRDSVTAFLRASRWRRIGGAPVRRKWVVLVGAGVGVDESYGAGCDAGFQGVTGQCAGYDALFDVEYVDGEGFSGTIADEICADDVAGSGLDAGDGVAKGFLANGDLGFE